MEAGGECNPPRGDHDILIPAAPAGRASEGRFSMRVTFLARLFSIAAVLAMGSLGPPAVHAQQATVYEGARLITGDGSAPIADSAFVVENGRFTAVGRKGQLKVPAGAAHVDLTGKTVMP